MEKSMTQASEDIFHALTRPGSGKGLIMQIEEHTDGHAVVVSYKQPAKKTYCNYCMIMP
jgi:hypothetical protein